MLNSPSLVFFDLGGVVVDVDVDWAQTHWAECTQLPRASFDALFFESGIKDALDRGTLSAAEGLAAISNRAAHPVSTDTARACFNRMLRVRPAVIELIESLTTKTRLAVISNTDPIHAAWIQENSGILPWVESWTFSFETGAMKPDPALLITALERVDCRPEQTLLIDDRSDNIASARSIGMRTIHYTHLDAVRTRLHEEGLL